MPARNDSRHGRAAGTPSGAAPDAPSDRSGAPPSDHPGATSTDHPGAPSADHPDAPSADRPAETPTHRVFFALEPDARTAAALYGATEAAARASGGRRIPPHNLHMTIAFLGAVSEPRLGEVRQVPPIRVGSFGLEFDHCGYLRRARTLTLEPRSVPPPLTALYELLWRGLSRAGFERERRPFRPHVTIARRASASKGAVEPVVWRVRALTLMESVPEGGGVRYRALDRWAL